VLITVAVDPPLEDTDFVVEPLHQPRLTLFSVWQYDAMLSPLAVNHRRELLVGCEPLRLRQGVQQDRTTD